MATDKRAPTVSDLILASWTRSMPLLVSEVFRMRIVSGLDTMHRRWRTSPGPRWCLSLGNITASATTHVSSPLASSVPTASTFCWTSYSLSQRNHKRTGRRQPARLPDCGLDEATRCCLCSRLQMNLGRVIGTVVATQKYEGLQGKKFLVVQPLDHALRSTGEPIVAVDTVRAGPGERWIYFVNSREAALALEPFFVPVDAAIVGIVDDVAAESPR